MESSLSDGAGDGPPRPIKGPLGYFARHRVLANLVMLGLVLGGLMTVPRLKQEVFPEVDLDLVTVTVVYPGATPVEIEQGVILAIEDNVRALEGVREVTSTASEGLGVVAIELQMGARPDRVLRDVESAVSRITSFPAEAERPVIALATNRRQVVSLVFHGDVPEATLRALVEGAREDLLALEDITLVELAGVRSFEISIEVPQETLRQLGLTLDEVASRVREASVELSGGRVETEGGIIVLRTDERRDLGQEFRDIALMSRRDGSIVRLSDVARIEDGFEDVNRAAFFDGERAARVDVFRVADERPLELSESVMRYADARRDELPSGVGLAVWNDTSEIFGDRIRLVLKNALIGFCLVVVVLGLFLEPRLGFWVTLGIPISFLGAILLLPATGISINLISLFAFLMTLGIVVDDAIVVGEAIHRRRREGLVGVEAATVGLRDVARPVVFAVLTTCIAFSPMLFVPGTSGKFFVNIPAVALLVLFLSLVECLLVLPAHLAHPMPALLRFVLGPFFWAMSKLRSDRISHALERFVERRYQPIVRAAVVHRYATASIAIAAIAITVGAFTSGRIGFVFFPEVESDEVRVFTEAPVGTAFERTLAIESRISREARALGEELGGVTRGVYSEVGTPSEELQLTAEVPEASHMARTEVELSPPELREISARQYADQLRERLVDIAGIERLSVQWAAAGIGEPPIAITLSHPDVESLERAAAALAAELEGFVGVVDVDPGFDRGVSELSFTLEEAGRAHGITEASLARQVRDAFFGAEALRQQRGREELRVYVRLPEEQRKSIADVQSLILRTPTGGEVPIGEAATITSSRAHTEIERRGGRRSIDVTAEVVPGQANANEVVATLLSDVLPRIRNDLPDLQFRRGGQQRDQIEALGTLGQGFTIALLAMYVLLAAAFGSYVQPIIVLSVIPVSFVGAILGHVLLGYDVSLISVFGLVALAGVAVNDSLLFVDAINQRREDEGRVDACVGAGMRRFRPILLTSLTTFFGLAPMIFETSVQARFLIPMALSLGFGVLFVTPITVLLVPALYTVVDDVHRFVRGSVARMLPKRVKS